MLLAGADLRGMCTLVCATVLSCRPSKNNHPGTSTPHQSQDNRARAVAWCKHALRLDVYCVEALEFLVERKLLRSAVVVVVVGHTRLSCQSVLTRALVIIPTAKRRRPTCWPTSCASPRRASPPSRRGRRRAAATGCACSTLRGCSASRTRRWRRRSSSAPCCTTLPASRYVRACLCV